MTLSDKIYCWDSPYSTYSTPHMAKRLLKLTRKPQHVYVLFSELFKQKAFRISSQSNKFIQLA